MSQSLIASFSCTVLFCYTDCTLRSKNSHASCTVSAVYNVFLFTLQYYWNKRQDWWKCNIFFVQIFDHTAKSWKENLDFMSRHHQVHSYKWISPHSSGLMKTHTSIYICSHDDTGTAETGKGACGEVQRKSKYLISTGLTSLPFKPKLIHMKDPPASEAPQLSLIVQSPGPYSIGTKGQTGVYKGGN